MVQKETLRVGAKSPSVQSKSSQGNSRLVIKKGKFEWEVTNKHVELFNEICESQSSDSEFDTKPYRDFLYKTGSEQRNLIHRILIELQKEPAPLKVLKLVEQLVLYEPGLFTQCDVHGKTPLLEAAQHNVEILCRVIDLLIPEAVLKDIKIPCNGRDRICPLSRVNKGRQRQCSKNRHPTGLARLDDPEQAEQIDCTETTDVQQDENDDVKVEGSCLCNLTDTNKMVMKDAQLRETLRAALSREQERQPPCLHLLIVNLKPGGKEHTERIPLDKFETLLELCPDTVFTSTAYDGYSPLQTAIRLYDKPFIDYEHLFLIIQALVNRLPSSIDVKAEYKPGGDTKMTAYRLLKGLSKTGDNMNAQWRSQTEDLLKRICIGSTWTWDSMRDFLYRDAKSVRQICLNLCGESSPLDESYISTIIDWSGMLFETVMVSVKLPYWRPQHGKSQGQDIAPGYRGGIGSDVVTVSDPYIAIFQWLHESGVQKIFTVEVDDTGPDPHTNSAIRQSLRGSTVQDQFSRDFEIEVWKWKKFDICSETIVAAAPMAKKVHLYSSGNTAVLRSWACSSGLPKLSELQQLEINIYPRNANDEADCRQYVPELRKKLANRCRRLQNEKINVKYSDSHAASGGSKRAALAGSDGEDQENISTDDNNSSNATLKSSEWIQKLKPFVNFIPNVLDPSKDKPLVRVALLDDGANLNDLPRGEQTGESFHPDKVGYFVGPCSHGTEMAQCIRAICPMAKLYIARLDDSRKRNGEVFTSASAYEALKWAISMGVDIISMSWTFKMKVNEMDDYEEKFMREIRDITSSVGSNKPILFGSYPDKGPTAEALQYAPVGLQGVIGIASATIYGEPSKENKQENPDFLLPGENLENSAGKSESGSSFSTAYASGLAALVLYCLRAHKDLGDDHMIPDSEDERDKRLKNAETGDGMRKIFTNFTKNTADNSFKKDPFVRPYNILGNKNFGLSDHEKRQTMHDIVSELLPKSQLKSLS